LSDRDHEYSINIADSKEKLDKYYDIPIKHTKKTPSATSNKNSTSNKNLTHQTSDSEKKRKVLDEIVKEQKNYNDDNFASEKKEDNEVELRPYSPPFTMLDKSKSLSAKGYRIVELSTEEKSRLYKRTSQTEIKTYKVDEETNLNMDLLFDEATGYYLDPNTKICYEIFK